MKGLNNAIGLIKFIVIFFGTGIVCLGMGIYFSVIQNSAPMDIYEMKESDFKNNLHIVSDIQCVYGEFYSETTERKTLGVTTSSTESARGYAIAILDEDGYYIEKMIGMKLGNKSDYTVMDRMIAESDDWYYDENGGPASKFMKTTYHFEGRLKKMTKEEYNLLVSGLGMTDKEAEEYILPYMLVPMRGSNAVLFIIGAVFLGIGILMVVLGKNNQKKEQEAEAARLMYQRQQMEEQSMGNTYGMNESASSDQVIINGEKTE